MTVSGIDAFDHYTVPVEVQAPLVDVFDEPLVIFVDVEEELAPRPRSPAQDIRFPVNTIQVNPILLPVENVVWVFPELTGTLTVA